jgi:putative transposase
MLHAHLVFTPKYRRGVFDATLLATTERVMSEVCADFGVTLVEFNGEDDHVHLLIEYPPTVQLSRLVNSLKGVSARVLRRDHARRIRKFLWGNHFWSPSYFVGSVGGAPLDILRTYIEGQRTPTA